MSDKSDAVSDGITALLTLLVSVDHVPSLTCEPRPSEVNVYSIIPPRLSVTSPLISWLRLISRKAKTRLLQSFLPASSLDLFFLFLFSVNSHASGHWAALVAKINVAAVDVCLPPAEERSWFLKSRAPTVSASGICHVSDFVNGMKDCRQARKQTTAFHRVYSWGKGCNFKSKVQPERIKINTKKKNCPRRNMS